jgi:hypothetical protein
MDSAAVEKGLELKSIWLWESIPVCSAAVNENPSLTLVEHSINESPKRRNCGYEPLILC